MVKIYARSASKRSCGRKSRISRKLRGSRKLLGGTCALTADKKNYRCATLEDIKAIKRTWSSAKVLSVLVDHIEEYRATEKEMLAGTVSIEDYEKFIATD
jgi:hypothetical protein